MNDEVHDYIRYWRERAIKAEDENARLKMIICGCVPILRGQINNYKKTLELIITVSELSQAITLAKRALEEVRDDSKC